MGVRVTIADLDLGNLHSLRKALERLGAAVEITPAAGEWLEAPVLVLPGDGAFGPAMRRLDAHRDALRQRFARGPALGICLGMQLLFERSAEAPGVPGLRVLPGSVERLPAERLPHMGWNAVRHDGSALFAGIPQGTYFYFVHSYGVLEHEAAVAWSHYDGRFVAAVRAGPSSYAVQFHPEKSGRWGLQLLKNFLELAEGR